MKPGNFQTKQCRLDIGDHWTENYNGRSEIIWTRAALQQLTSCGILQIIIKCIIPSPNGLSPAHLWKAAASLPSLVVEGHVQELQNGRQWSRAEMYHMVPLERRLSSIYLQFLERKNLHTAVFNWMHSFNSGQETAQMTIYEWYHNTPKE